MASTNSRRLRCTVAAPAAIPTAATPTMPARPTHFQIRIEHYRMRTMGDGEHGALSYTAAERLTRTGDVWLFRGRSSADRAIRAFTISPVNHVGMVVALDDLPPVVWHAELGRTSRDVWTGYTHRGTQLHRLVDAVGQWHHRYGQQAWMRQIDIDVTVEMEDALIETIADLDGRTFPGVTSLAKGWIKGRARRKASIERLFCGEVVAITYERMGLLGSERPPNWYDPGKFWSGDRLALQGAALGAEIAIDDIPVFEPTARAAGDDAGAGSRPTPA